ncbi:MAG TPA: divalent metal cation transporter, partial [Bacillota bacterium]|nr:divalent metal cation transporter [Bacillota bacterium]
ITINGAEDMAAQLTPILGTYAGILFSLGLWAAAFSSGVYQITLASRFLNEAIGKEIDVKAPRSRIVMVLASLLPVAIILFFEDVPVSIIITAQSLNGLALPLVAGTVLVLANNKRFLGEKVNSMWQNIIYSIILIVVSFLAIRVFLDLFGVI